MRLSDLFAACKFSRQSAKKQFELAGIVFLVLFVIVGIIYCALLPPVARFTDEQEYLKLSTSLLHGSGFSLDGVHLTAARAPGYAFFLAALQWGGGGFFTIRVAQILLLGATMLLVAQLGSGGETFAGLLFVTMLVGFYPVLIYTGSTLYPQTLAGFLFILSLTLMLTTGKGPARFLASGISFGMLILVVPTFLFTMAVVLGAARILNIIRGREAALMLVAAAMVIGSWTLRNAVCLGHVVPIATNSGLNFLEGNNPNAYAEAAANVGMKPYYEQAGKLGLDEFQCDAFYRQAAFSWIKAHPVDAFILYLEKVTNFFNIRNVYSSQSEPEVSPWRQIVLAAGYLLLLGLLCWRLMGIGRFPLNPREKLFLSVYILSAFTSAIFFTRIRHRLPYDFLLIAIIASNLSRRLEAWFMARRITELFPERSVTTP
jgi:hypothetical protein